MNILLRSTNKLRTFWLRNRDVKITQGYAAGLVFRTGRGNPEYMSGEYELPVQEAVVNLLNPGMVFYDIGANVGFFSVLAAKYVGSTGKVFAFEPLPANARAVHHNITTNNLEQVEIFQQAVSRVTGKEKLYVSDFSGGSALESGDRPPDLVDEIEVEVVSIDDLVNNGEIDPPDVVKIDVEGAEINVLEGMRETIAKYRPVIVYELDDHDRQNYQSKQQLCTQFLTGLGYSIRELELAYPGGDWIVGNFVASPPIES